MTLDAAISAIIALIGIIISITTAAFIAGNRVGGMEGRLNSIEKDVAEIKGMFRLTLRKDSDG